MKFYLKLAVLPLALCLAFTGLAAETALDRYVKAPDPSYRYDLVNTLPGSGYTTYVIELTSQTWRTPAEVNRTVWKHWLIIVKPDQVEKNTGYLFITGGSVNAKAPDKIDDPTFIDNALTTHTVVAELQDVPNEPLQFKGETRKRSEDAIIAYTQVKYLTTGDETWPLRLPMTKAAVRAMDTITAFLATPAAGGVKVDKFVVSGGSKRGWTTWTTAAVDPRVVAIIPMSIDMLNQEKSFQHHYRVYGFWAPSVKDYVEAGLMDWSGTPEYRKLLEITEPYSYRARLTMPKFIVNAAGDQFFLPDSSRFYFDDLKGEKYLRYLPNTNHHREGTDYRESNIAFYQSILTGARLPRFTWKFEGNGDIRVVSKDKPTQVKLWQAVNPEHRDFRLLTIGPAYKSSDLKGRGGGVYVAHVLKPERGWVAYFVEMTYPGVGKYPLKFTTGVRVAPDTEPFPAYVPNIRNRTGLLILLGAIALLADSPSPGRLYTTLVRLEPAHLEAVHQARLKFAKERKTLPQLGVYTDYRAVMHVHAEDAAHTKGTRAEVLQGAKEAGVRIVMFTDHRGPKPDTWSGVRDGVLFIPGSEDDHLLRFPKPGQELRFLSHLEETPGASSAGFQGMEIYNRHTDAKDEKAFDDYFRAATQNPAQWEKLATLEHEYPDEVFAAGTDYWPSIFAKWDQETGVHPFTGIAANDSHKNQTYNGVTFDPYEVSFRSVSTHILARELSDAAVRESLLAGRAYVAHDWLCDPTGFAFTAQNNYGVYDVGDQAPMLKNTRLAARLPVAADIRIIHNGTQVSQSEGSQITFTPTETGAYRVEAWLTVDGEQRPWIYSNPIYLVNPGRLTLPSGELSPGVTVRKDITYAEGLPTDAGKHKLDVYVPAELPGAKANFPVLIFLHGGSWRSGDRSNYPALANRFAREGIIVVVPSYRLMPGAPHPAQVEDAAAAVQWTIRNISEYGGNSKRIYLSGHSAGGHLAAYVGLRPEFWPNLKGVLTLSGVYDVSQIAGFKDDPANASPIQHVKPGAPPFLIEYCQNDYPSLPLQARNFDAALKQAGVSTQLVYVPNANHISEIVNVYKADDPIALAILRFIEEHR